jgi:hypothetical protein
MVCYCHTSRYQPFRFSWKRMFVHHPHLRYDGIYVARNTYVKVGRSRANQQQLCHTCLVSPTAS